MSLLLAQKVEQDKKTAFSSEIRTVPPESLMTFIAVDKNKSPVLNVVNLIDNGVTVTASFNVVDPTFDPAKGLIAAFYRISDQISGLPDLNNGFTCADFAIGPVCGGGSPLVLITSLHQVPVANSLMLLAIGLMALRVPQRCGKLS